MTNLADPVTMPDECDAPSSAFAAPSGAPVGVPLPPPSGLPAEPVAASAAPAPDAPTFLPPELPEYRPPAPPAAAAQTPTIAPVVPPTAAKPPPTPQPAVMPDFSAFTTPTVKKKSGGGGFFKFVFVLAVLGGLGAAGYVYGPTLLDKIREETGDPAEAETASESSAPLAFPTQTAAPIAVRNATFVLDDLDPEGTTRRYEITTDFETRASRVLIDRDELPTLEVLTFLDQAVVRRVGDDVWYRTARGRFPLDDQLERDRWVRHLDELIPVGNRPQASIEESTTSQLGDEQMRRLVVSIDPALLAGPAIATESFGRVAAVATTDEPPNIIDATSEAVDAATNPDPPPPAPAGNDAARVTGSPDGAAPAPPQPADGTVAVEAVSIEIWIDSHGLIRQLVSPDVLGGERLTVTTVSAEPWLPEFPLEEQVRPLTASALVELGL